MSTGDSTDILGRIKQLIPGRWFAYVAPIRDAVLGGLSDSAAWCYSWITYARAQSRLKTMTGPFLDIAAWDFFQGRFGRRQGESDTMFQPRIVAEILRPRQTRPAILQMLKDLTGRNGYIFEPWNPGDCGAYGSGFVPTQTTTVVGVVTGTGAGAGNVVQLQLGAGDVNSVAGFTSGDTVTVANVAGTIEANGTWVIDVIIFGSNGRINLRGSTFVHAWSPSGGTITDVVATVPARPSQLVYGASGYGVAGCYGSLQFRNQMFVTAYRPAGNGIANVAGYGNPQAGYGSVGSMSMYGDISLITGPVTDAEIYQRIANTIAAGTAAWVDIKS